MVNLGLEIGDDDMAGVENEGVGAAEPGQGIGCVVAAEAAIEDVGVAVAGEIIAELRAEQIGNIRERVGSRAAGILRYENVEADGYSGRCMLIARGVVRPLTDQMIIARPALQRAVAVAGQRVV